MRAVLGFDTVYLFAKFEDSIDSAVPEISLGASKFKWAHDPDHAPFKGDLSSL